MDARYIDEITLGADPTQGLTLASGPGCQSQGDSYEEAEANIKEAIELYLETLNDDEYGKLLSAER